MFARFKMECDVPAIVDVCAGELGRRRHRSQNFFGDGSRYCSHRGYESLLAVRGNCLEHPASDNTYGAAGILSHRLPQKGKLGAELVEHGHKSLRRSTVGCI